MPATCSATRRDGEPCRTPVVSGSQWCFGHHPDLAEQRTQARRRGGQNRSNAQRVAKLLPQRLTPVFQRLEQALEETHDGTLDPKVATALAALARAMATILTAGELEARVRELEQRDETVNHYAR